MTDKELVRGDDYWDDRPIFTATITDNALAPYDLTSCTIRATWRESTVAPDSDPDDAAAAFTSSIVFDGSGAVTSSSNMQLPDGGVAGDGVLLIVAARAYTSTMPLAADLEGDVQITNAQGKVETRFVLAKLSTRDGYTSEAP